MSDYELHLDYLNFENEDSLTTHISIINNIMDIFNEDFSSTSRISKVNIILDKETFTIRLNDLFYSLLLQISRLHSKINYIFNKESFIFDIDNVDNAMADYYNYNIDNFSKETDIHIITKQIGISLELIAKYAWDINFLKGNSVNLYDIIKLSETNKEVKEILNFEVNEASQYSEIEQSITDKMERLIILLKEVAPENSLTAMLSVTNIGQFQQAFVNIGLKPDLYEEIIPKPINTSFFRGMRNSTDFFINTVGARKALITNASQVRKAGYLSRKLELLLLATTLSKEEEDCGERPLLPMYLEDSKTAKRYTNRYYKLDEADKEFKLISRHNLEEVLDRDIFLATPITCNLASENKVCKTCYGKMSDLNNFHIGLVAMLTISEQIIQRLLSSKHLLKVISEFIELPGELNNYFEIDKNNIIALKACKIKILEYSIDDFSTNKLIEKIGIYTVKNVLLEEIKIDEMEMYLKSDFDNDDNDDDFITIDVKENDELFRLDIQNNGLAVPLKKLLKLIESGEEMNARGSVVLLVNEILDLLVESKINLSGFGIELMVRELARDPENLQEKSYEDGKIEFLRLTSAIIESPSASISLAFQEYNRLLEGKLFTKNKSSPLDVLF